MRTLLLALSILSTHFLQAQHEADKWYFGVNAGLDFSAGAPVVITNGALNTSEGSSSICDASGNLLFYTDGVSVWNSNHVVMPNGTGLMGGTSSTQAALIVPVPGSTTLFYIFTVDEAGGANGLRYSKVDMSLLSGSGDVTIKNILLRNNMTEKLTAFAQQFGSDYWITAHDWGTNSFYSYRLTAAGIQDTIISSAGSIHTTAQIQNTFGQMKFSTCGDRLALAIGYQDTVQVFDFNENSGVVSNPVSIPFNDHVYGVEFSENGNYLYVSCYDPSGTLLQFNLTAGSASAIVASKTVLSSVTDIYGLQLGSDGKIYVTKSFNPNLGVINSPETGGASCNYVDQAINLDPGSSGLMAGLTFPGFPQSFFHKDAACTNPSGISSGTETSFDLVFPNPASGSFFIQSGLFREQASVSVFDISGKLIETFQTNGTTIAFGENYVPGMYFVVFEFKSSRGLAKAVKQP